MPLSLELIEEPEPCPCGQVHALTNPEPEVEDFCENCGEGVELGYAYCDDCGPGYDDAADSDNADAEGLIRQWDYKPPPRFHGQGPVFLGAEVEVESSNLFLGGSVLASGAEYAADTLGSLGYLKDDGSLNCGFEVVTHPMSYSWALNNFPWRVFPGLAERSFTAAESCGLHVHVSRTAFQSPAHTYRWLKLLYRNPVQVQAIARRQSSRWAAFQDTDRFNAKNYAKGGRGDHDRYRAVNVTNPDTFEVRVFASSLDTSEIKAAFGLVDASVAYTRDLTVPAIADGGWGWNRFAAWVAGQKRYEPLAGEIEKRTNRRMRSAPVLSAREREKARAAEIRECGIVERNRLRSYIRDYEAAILDATRRVENAPNDPEDQRYYRRRAAEYQSVLYDYQTRLTEINSLLTTLGV